MFWNNLLSILLPSLPPLLHRFSRQPHRSLFLSLPLLPSVFCVRWGGWRRSTLLQAGLCCAPRTAGCMFTHLVCQDMRMKAVTLSSTKSSHQWTMCLLRTGACHTQVLFMEILSSKLMSRSQWWKISTTNRICSFPSSLITDHLPPLFHSLSSSSTRQCTFKEPC